MFLAPVCTTMMMVCVCFVYFNLKSRDEEENRFSETDGGACIV